MRVFARVFFLIGAWLVFGPAVVSAQPVGTFRWQLEPFCNVVSVAVVQQAAVFTLDGTDDQCGAAQQASVAGLAFLHPNGSIGIGLLVVTTPGATPIHIDATINAQSLGGTWRDSAGNSGAFVFTPGPGHGGARRPVPPSGLPPGSVTLTQMAPGSVGAAQMLPNAVTGASVIDHSLTSADLADGPRGGIAPNTGNVFALSSGVAKVVRTLTINAPGPGQIIANASGTVEMTKAPPEIVACAITQFPQNVDDTAFRANVNFFEVRAFIQSLPFAMTRGFEVPPGPFTMHLVCLIQSVGTQLGESQVARPQLTAIWVPQ